MNEVMGVFRSARKHKDFDTNRWLIVEMQDPVLVKNIATPESRKLYNMACQVDSETHLIKSFARIEADKKGILYMETLCDHYIEFYILSFFKERFPLFDFIVSTQKGCFISEKGQMYKNNNSLEDNIRLLSEGRPDNSLLSGMNLSCFDITVWRSFFSSQYIKERRNRKLQKKHVPKKYSEQRSIRWEMCENANRQLSEFF